MVAQIFVQIDANLYTKRGHKVALNHALRTSLEWWRDNRLPQRFENNAKTRPGGELGFFTRSKGWQLKKAKVKGHQRPNVYSGALRASVLTNSPVRATAGANPKATFRAKCTFPMTPARRREFEYVPPDERDEIISQAVEAYKTASQRPELMDRVKLRTRNRP